MPGPNQCAATARQATSASPKHVPALSTCPKSTPVFRPIIKSPPASFLRPLFLPSAILCEKCGLDINGAFHNEITDFGQPWRGRVISGWGMPKEMPKGKTNQADRGNHQADRGNH